MLSHSQSPQRNRRPHSGIPDDTTPRSLRPVPMAQAPADLPHPPPNPPPYPPQKRSPPAATIPQHVSSSNSQPYSNPQYHQITDSNPNSAPIQGPSHSQPQRTPPLTFPRPVQRVPPPPLIPTDPRFELPPSEWMTTDQLFTEIDSTAPHDQDPMNLAAIAAAAAQSPTQIHKPPVMIDRERTRDRTDSPRDAADVAGSGGSAGSATARNGSIRRQSNPMQHESPSRTPPNALAPASQQQRPLPVVIERPPAPRRDSSRSSEQDRRSPTYFAALANHSPHHGQTRLQNDSPSFQYDEHVQAARSSTAKTPDRSLPVQEENEGEEDVTITSASLRHEKERERELEIERERELEQVRQREQELLLELEKSKERSRHINHRLPTPQFSTSPMIPPDRMRMGGSPSEVELSTTVQGDEFSDGRAIYSNEHDGRSSRATHHFDDDGIVHHNDDNSRLVDRRPTAHDGDDQDETESYTPKSHHTNLPPQVIPGNNGAMTERVVYSAAAHALPHVNFRPRTASSDGGGMANLDTAMLRDAIERLQDPYTPENGGGGHPPDRGEHAQHFHKSPTSLLYGQHTSYPNRAPTADEVRTILGNDPRMYDAWQTASAHLHRPGAPVPPTPPNAAANPSLPRTAQSFSPPPRSTPYPYTYQYQHLLHRSQDTHQLLHHLQQQQLQFLATGGMQSDSTFSPSTTPYPAYSPFLAEHLRRQYGVEDPSMSMRSSPSHLPVSLPMLMADRKIVQKRQSVRRVRGSRELASKLPPRGESTEPRETDSSGSEEGEEVEEEQDPHTNHLDASGGSSESITAHQLPSEEGEWVDDDEDDEDDLLQFEYHPSFVVNRDKRRKRWEVKWAALVKAFQALDRQTDSTLILLASSDHGKSLHSLRSRSLRRLPTLASSPEISQIKSSFIALSSKRKMARSNIRHPSLADLFELYAGSSAMSEAGENREEELKNALGAALSSLSTLSDIYEGREQRWKAEMSRMSEERERVEVLLRQALGGGTLMPGMF